MNCEECLEKLSSYVDHALSSHERDQVDAHIANCSHCAEQVSIMQEMVKALGQLADVELPVAFHQELMQTLEAEKRHHHQVKKFSPTKWIYWASGMAATLLVGMIWLLQIPQGASEAPDPMSLQENTRAIPEPQGKAMPFAVASMPMTDEIVGEKWTAQTSDVAELEKWLEKNSTTYGYALQVTIAPEGTYMLMQGIVDKEGLIEELKAIQVEITVDQPSDAQEVTIFIKK